MLDRRHLLCFVTASRKSADVTNSKPKYDIKVCERIINNTRANLDRIKIAVGITLKEK